MLIGLTENMDSNPQACFRSFPQPCSECGEEQVNRAVIEYDAEVKYDGKLYQFHISRLTVNKCGACGEVYFDTVTNREISQALREHLHLLSPEQIREHLARLGLSQREFSQKIEIAEETVSRWLNGAKIQSRAYDKLMRLFFEREESRLAQHAVL